MKLSLLSPTARSISLSVAAFCLLSIASPAPAADNLGAQIADAVWDIHDAGQAVVRKSVKGYMEAMQEGPPPDNGGKPFDLDYLQQVQQKNQKLYDAAKTLAENQQKLLEIDQKILQQLPPNDPRRSQIEAEMKKVGEGIPETRKKQKEWGNSLATANDAVDNWKKKEDVMYVPPVRPNTKSKSPPVQNTENEPSGPSGPTGPTGPTGPVGPGPYTGGGGPTGPIGPVTTGGGNIDAWKAKEAEIENKARNLGKDREQAVIDYLNNPTEENKAKAAELKQKLDGLVNKLNKVRGKVDGLTGGSRPPLKAKTAKQIKNKWKKGGMTAGGGGEDHHHGPDGTDASGSGSEGHHHGANGQDVPNKYVSDGGGGGGQGRTGKTAGTRAGKKRGGGQKGKTRTASAKSGHSHGPGGVDIPNNQARGQGGGRRGGGGGKRRMAAAQQTRQTQQANTGGYNLANQNQAQNPNQQRRKKKQRGY